MVKNIEINKYLFKHTMSREAREAIGPLDEEGMHGMKGPLKKKGDAHWNKTKPSRFKYMLKMYDLAESKTEKDLGVVVDSMMKIFIQYTVVVKKRNSMMEMKLKWSVL